MGINILSITRNITEGDLYPRPTALLYSSPYVCCYGYHGNTLFCHCQKICLAHLLPKTNICTEFHDNWSKTEEEVCDAGFSIFCPQYAVTMALHFLPLSKNVSCIYRVAPKKTERHTSANTVEPRYNEVLGTMKITLLYQVSHYIRVKETEI